MEGEVVDDVGEGAGGCVTVGGGVSWGEDGEGGHAYEPARMVTRVSSSRAWRVGGA